MKSILSTFALTVLVFGATCARAENMYVADTGGGFLGPGFIYKFNTASGAGSRTTFSSDVSSPYGLAFDSNTNLFEVDLGSSGINKFTPAGTKSTFTDASSGLAPYGLAFDSNGNLFEADYGGGKIYEFIKTGGTLSSTPTLFASGLTSPYALAFDSSGNLFVSDGPSGKIYKFIKTGGTLSSTPTLFASGFTEVNGLAFDSNGNLFAADFGDSNVMVSGNIKKFVNTGGVLSSSPVAFSSNVNHPIGLAFDSSGNLFETDSFTAKVQEFINTAGTLSSTPITFTTLAFPTFIAFEPKPAIVVSAPALAIKGSSASVTVSWPAPSTGFLLQTNSGLTAANWVNYGGPITTANGTNSVAITPPTGNLLFRLKQ